ncbi:MAG TPA: acyl-CoA dehydrogenase family protein [Acidimicrobiales bacterium]
MPAAHPLVAAARRVAADVLAPAAEDVDRADLVPAAHLLALAGAGLFDLTGLAPPDTRLVFEALAGACGATFFVWAQHHAPVGDLAASPNRDLARRWLPPLRDGRALGGVAFAYLRRPGPPAVVAEPDGAGWRLRGSAPWVTSWGLADGFAVSAAAPGDRVVTAWLPAERLTPARGATAVPLDLSVMAATGTVRLDLDGVAVATGDVMADVDAGGWRAADRVGTVSPAPAALGVAATCARLLGEREPAVAGAVAAEVDAARARGEVLAAPPPGERDLDALAASRADQLVLATRAALALVAATSGAAVLRSSPAQRLAREAAFYLVQAQVPPVKAAVLDRLAT